MATAARGGRTGCVGTVGLGARPGIRFQASGGRKPLVARQKGADAPRSPNLFLDACLLRRAGEMEHGDRREDHCEGAGVSQGRSRKIAGKSLRKCTDSNIAKTTKQTERIEVMQRHPEQFLVYRPGLLCDTCVHYQ